MSRARKIWVNLLTVGVSLLLSLLLMELVLFLLYRHHILLIEPPSYDVQGLIHRTTSSALFRDNNEKFGTWHVPNSHFVHDRSCFSVRYSFNSFGARDRDRTLTSSAPRAVMLGDSFVEGYGLISEARLSDLMEAWSGREVLNFGISGNAGTVQYLLIYRYLAGTFDHSLVLVGFLPDNDFQDNDYEYGLKAHVNRFRPYLVGQYPDYRLVFFNRESFDAREDQHPWGAFATNCLREFTFSYRTLGYIIRLRNEEMASQAKKDYSGYYDFREKDWDLVRFTLEEICALAREKNAKVLVFAIPRERDVERYKIRGKPPLSQRLQLLGDRTGFVFVDLLPGFAARCDGNDPRSQGYWLPCDPHWSERGSRLALELLEPYLTQMSFSPTAK